MASRWTEREVNFVHDYVGIKSYAELAEQLGRSEEAIKLYRCRHHLPRAFDNFYSYTLLAKELGRARASLRKYFKRGWLKGRKADWVGVYGKVPMIFLEDDIVVFLQERYYLFEPRKVPNIYFRNVVRDAYNEVKS